MQRKNGFTIVELLVVIVVIGILAAVVIIAYNGVRAKAIDASIQSDASNAAKILENDRTTSSTNTYPVNAAAANSGKGLPSSSGNTYSYAPDNASSTPSYTLKVS